MTSPHLSEAAASLSPAALSAAGSMSSSVARRAASLCEDIARTFEPGQEDKYLETLADDAALIYEVVLQRNEAVAREEATAARERRQFFARRALRDLVEQYSTALTPERRWSIVETIATDKALVEALVLREAARA